MWNKIKNKFLNSDGTLNGKIIAGVISLVIVLVYQLAGLFGLQLKGNADAVAEVINLVLLILGLMGVVENPGKVEVPHDLIVHNGGQVSIDADKVQVVKPTTSTSSVSTSQSVTSESITGSDSNANSQS